jgi:hypothetical protein
MSMSDSLTTRQVGEIFGEPEWRIRRIVDRIGSFQRFGGKRAIPRERLAEIAAQLSKRKTTEAK